MPRVCLAGVFILISAVPLPSSAGHGLVVIACATASSHTDGIRSGMGALAG